MSVDWRESADYQDIRSETGEPATEAPSCRPEGPEAPRPEPVEPQ